MQKLGTPVRYIEVSPSLPQRLLGSKLPLPSSGFGHTPATWQGKDRKFPGKYLQGRDQ